MDAPAEMWFEIELEDDWVAAYRMADQDGRVQIIEARVFPSSPEFWDAHRQLGDAGRWAAERLGGKAPVPAGGLKTKALRQLGSEKHRTAALRAFEMWRLADREDVIALLREQDAADVVFDDSSPGLSNRFLAEVAARYVACCGAGIDPIGQLRLQLAELGQKKARSTVAEYVRFARARGLLTEAPAGTKGGSLTGRGEALLAASGSSSDITPPRRPRRDRDPRASRPAARRG